MDRAACISDDWSPNAAANIWWDSLAVVLKRLQCVLNPLQERIQIMHALVQSAPQLGQSRDVPLTSMPTPSAPPMAGGPETATHHAYPEILPPSQGKGCHVSKLWDM